MQEIDLILSSEKWLSACASQLQRSALGLRMTEAVSLAIDLHRAWPRLTPAEAAEAFTSPLLNTVGTDS